MTTFEKLDKLTLLARADDLLRHALIDTENCTDPLSEFCAIAQKNGVDLSVGELFAVGLEYSDNQCKSTNGGNPSPYDSFDDAYENFILSIK